LKGSTILVLGLGGTAAVLGLGYYFSSTRVKEEITAAPIPRVPQGTTITTVDDRDVYYNNKQDTVTNIVNYEIPNEPAFPEINSPETNSVAQDKPSKKPDKTPKEVMDIVKDIKGDATYDPATGVTITVEKQRAESKEIPTEWKTEEGFHWYRTKRYGVWSEWRKTEYVAL
jgi:hypothetical protein